MIQIQTFRISKCRLLPELSQRSGWISHGNSGTERCSFPPCPYICRLYLPSSSSSLLTRH